MPEGLRSRAVETPASKEVELFETDGSLYGHLSGKFLITANGTCTHIRAGTGGRYFYSVKDRRLEFRQDADGVYAINDDTCRWRIGE